MSVSLYNYGCLSGITAMALLTAMMTAPMSRAEEVATLDPVIVYGRVRT